MRRHSVAIRRDRRWFLRLRAVLAGGLVLGVGGALTLAAWTDQEHAAGTFEAGVFGIEGNPNGTVWGEHPTGQLAATLNFSTGTVMYPSSLHYAYLDLRTTAVSTMSGTVKLASSVGTGDLSPYLSYRVALVPAGTGCNASSVTGAYLGTGTLPATEVARGVAAKATNTVRYCFEVRLDPATPNAMQGKAGAISWGFAAESATP
ncbi:SipW-dependent-type signal peptide-containing protein [Arthrobacter crystallopoietes]|uniref:SipW-dependent-type signal peptide-containing protein n=1 Tax=Crystallibacter crystallopoietes TaxID=37928 RepID=UPI001ABEB620|nr:SipW-dependent-type signal peptide-containing protein [Arthrobacter crystallopoietes]QTG79531.1 hypothetical protein J5251_11300 [Arthrobacter crystallopoietes]